MEKIYFSAMPGDWIQDTVASMYNYAENLIEDKSVIVLPEYTLRLEENKKVEWEKEASYESWKRDQFIALKQYFDGFELTPDFILELDFNGAKIQCIVNDWAIQTTVQDMVQQYNFHCEEETRKREEWLASEEGLLYLQEQAFAQEQAKLEKQLILSKLQTLSFTKDEIVWSKWVSSNQDGYGQGILNFAENWAKLMEDEIDNNNSTVEKIAQSASSKADTECITGFMYGAAVKILSECWKYREQLRVWHSAEYGATGEGVVNPAVLTISV